MRFCNIAFKLILQSYFYFWVEVVTDDFKVQWILSQLVRISQCQSRCYLYDISYRNVLLFSWRRDRCHASSNCHLLELWYHQTLLCILEHWTFIYFCSKWLKVMVTFLAFEEVSIFTIYTLILRTIGTRFNKKP